MSSDKGDYYIYVCREGYDEYSFIHTDNFVECADNDRIIYMFNVHSRQIAKLAIYLFREKLNEEDKRITSNLYKKIQNCIYKAQCILN